jgi:hypothetical protein
MAVKFHLKQNNDQVQALDFPPLLVVLKLHHRLQKYPLCLQHINLHRTHKIIPEQDPNGVNLQVLHSNKMQLHQLQPLRLRQIQVGCNFNNYQCQKELCLAAV